jgi:hypothetical protein
MAERKNDCGHFFKRQFAFFENYIGVKWRDFITLDPRNATSDGGASTAIW